MKSKHMGSVLFLVVLIALLNLSSVSAQTEYPTPNTNIQMDGTSISVDGGGASVAGSTVTITSAGTYSLSGTLSDGQIIVDTDDIELVTLILNGVVLTSSTSAPIYIKEAETAAILLMDGTENFITDAVSYIYENVEDDEPNAAVFSDDDLTIYGQGTLNVVANYNDGITSKDTLSILSGTINVNAADDGIRGKDWLVVDGAQLNITAHGDGLKSDNEDDATLGYITINSGVFNLSAGGDAIQAQTTLTINDGTFSITAGGGSSVYIDDTTSAKALKATTNVVINGGTFTLNAADDAIHSNDSIVINNGAFTIATGDDGIHADASIEVNGGIINISNSYEGIESAVITINDGDIHIIASDDGLNVAGGTDGSGFGGRGMPGGGPGAAAPGGFATSSDYLMVINGGTLYVDAEGDGLDANGAIEMNGGFVIVNGPTGNMNGAVDYDGYFTLTGGTLLAAGSSGMLQAPDNSSTQYSLAVGFDTALQAGTLVHIENSAGETVLTFSPTKMYQSIVFSSPTLVSGETYTLYQGGSAVGTITDGLYQGETYTPGTLYTSLTLTNITTQLGSGGGGGFGGRP